MEREKRSDSFHFQEGEEKPGKKVMVLQHSDIQKEEANDYDRVRHRTQPSPSPIALADRKQKGRATTMALEDTISVAN